MSKIYNYTAFYVNEPFSETSLGANASKDFCYYNMLKAWKGLDTSFPFNNSHDTTYNVRDSSDWEATLKPRLHERLRNSQNLILFLSDYTANSRALKEEVDYAINKLNLPIIVIYPDLKSKEELLTFDNKNLNNTVMNLWNKLPVFRDSKHKVPVLHIPLKKETIKIALSDSELRIDTVGKVGNFFYKP
jgi:hypothetical protein